jgi:hypothetical protein
MGNKLKHIVQVFLDIERPSGIVLTEAFVNYRWDFFMQYTYPSLVNQTFQDFEIWLICGWRHRAITGNIHCHENTRIKIIYPVPVDPTLSSVVGDTFTIAPKWRKKPTLMIKEFGEQDADYLAITRIDSDDLFSRDAMLEIHGEANIAIHKVGIEERCRLLFTEYIYWDMLNHFISFQRWENPPFYTHVFPREVYQDWDRLQKLHFNNHRYMGGGHEKILCPYKVLVTYHKQNIARIKRGKELNHYTKVKLDEFRRKGFRIETNRSIMDQHLREFEVYDYAS